MSSSNSFWLQLYFVNSYDKKKRSYLYILYNFSIRIYATRPISFTSHFTLHSLVVKDIIPLPPQNILGYSISPKVSLEAQKVLIFLSGRYHTNDVANFLLQGDLTLPNFNWDICLIPPVDQCHFCRVHSHLFRFERSENTLILPLGGVWEGRQEGNGLIGSLIKLMLLK